MFGLPEAFFYFFATVVLGIGCIVAFSRNLLHAAFALFFVLFGISGFYVLLGADFIAVVQVMVYAGGINVLLIFGTMLTADMNQPENTNRSFQGILSFVSGAAIFALLLSVFEGVNWPTTTLTALESTTKPIGRLLLSTYIFPFEVISFLLLAAMVGALVLIIKGDSK